MGTVPLLFDKSAFQSLNKREHLIVERYFIPNVTPVLVNEIVGDLKKEFPNGKPPEENVALLAEKFFGTGTSVSMSYRKLIQASLDGAPVPMKGQIIPENGISVQEEDGSQSVLFDPGPANWLILRLAQKQVNDEDLRFAEAWRSASANLSLAKLNAFMLRHRIAVPRPRNMDALPAAVDAILDAEENQNAWLAWWVEPLRNRLLAAQIEERWRRLAIGLREFAPYAHFCLRALLLLLAANRAQLIPKWKSSDLVDLQYLYYLPCCGVFVSGDRVHRGLAPHLLRADQRFIRAEIFKAALRELADYTDGLDAEARKAVRSEPPMLDGNVVSEAWHHVVDAWDELWRAPNESGPMPGL